MENFDVQNTSEALITMCLLLVFNSILLGQLKWVRKWCPKCSKFLC